MKKIVLLLTVLITSLAGNAQIHSLIRSKKVAIDQTLTIRGNANRIDSLKKDTIGWLGSVKSIATADAIYKFVIGRVGSGGGGGGTPTLQNVLDQDNNSTASIFFNSGASSIYSGGGGITFSNGGGNSSFIQGVTNGFRFYPAANTPRMDFIGSLLTAQRSLLIPDETDTIATRSWTRGLGFGGGGSTETASEGLTKTGLDIKLGGPIGSPGILGTERNIRINRKALHFTNGMDAEAGGDIWQWSYRSYSPINIRTKDTVTSNDMPYSANMPLSAINAQRDIYYPSGVYRQYGIYGHRFAYYHYGTDSFVVRSDGDDYNQAVIAESRYRSAPGYTGRTLIQTSHSNASVNSEGPAALVGNVIVGNDVAGARVVIKGQLQGIVSYLVTQGMNADTIPKFNFFKNRTFITGPGKLLKGIIYASGPTGADSSWYLLDSLGYRNYLHGGLSLGGGYTGILNQFRNHFDTYLNDSVRIATMRNWNDSTNIDLVLSPRTAGSHALRKMRFDQFASLLGNEYIINGSSTALPIGSSPNDSTLKLARLLPKSTSGRVTIDTTASNADELVLDFDLANLPAEIQLAASDETTDITTGTAKVTFRMPYAMTVTAVRASLTTASSSGVPTIDINENGTTILSTKITIDASEKTSTTAATAPVISDTSLADDAEITIDVDVAGTGAKGLKVLIKGTRNP